MSRPEILARMDHTLQQLFFAVDNLDHKTEKDRVTAQVMMYTVDGIEYQIQISFEANKEFHLAPNIAGVNESVNLNRLSTTVNLN